MKQSWQEKLKVYQQVKKYEREIEVLFKGKKKYYWDGIALHSSMTCVFFCAFMTVSLPFAHLLPSVAISFALGNVLSFFVNKNITRTHEEINMQYEKLSISKKQEYNIILENAKDLTKTYNLKKLNQFIKDYEIRISDTNYTTSDKDTLVFWKEHNKPIPEQKQVQTETIGTLEPLYQAERQKTTLETHWQEDIYTFLEHDPNSLKENAKQNPKIKCKTYKK